MSSVITSLKEISQQYTVFSKDQVLTDSQLNSITDYLDDQTRLTRTALSGVGIIEGLVVSATNTQCSLSKGVGITRDGDLFANYAPIRFDRAKEFPDDGPEYPPFMNAEKRLPLYQLVEVGADDPKAAPISQLDIAIQNCLFILFAESVIEDTDICTGTNCDNGSRTYHTRMRVLAIDLNYAELLRSPNLIAYPSEQEVARLYPPSITFNASIDTQTEWFSRVRQQCANIGKQLNAAFSSFWPNYKDYLYPYFDGNPSETWAGRLQAALAKSKTENARNQYLYEFLSDLCDTYNALIDALEEVRPGLLVGADSGSKHLLLGTIGGQGLRSEFIAAPIHARQAMQPVHFYVNKLTELLASFGWTRISALKITPSSHVEPSLPGYYGENTFNLWDYAATQSNKTRYLLGYNADKNNPRGGAQAPLERRQSGFDFYRIEGVLGKTFSATQSQLKQLIKQYHLPISVTGVLIEGSFNDVIIPIRPFTNNFGHLKHMFKKDLSYQLQDVTNFSTKFKNEVVEKSQQQPLVDGEDIDLSDKVQTRDNEIRSKATSAMSLLKKDKLNTEEKTMFKADLTAVVKSAGMFKSDVASVSTTHFPTMFDQIITSPTIRWIDWLDILADDDEKTEKEKSQLPSFLSEFPGFEVSNGVVRGGTFVLVYNSSGTIVGTGMLSHYIPMPVERVPLLPSLPKFEFPLDQLRVPGIQVAPSLGKRFLDFGSSVTQQVDERFSSNTNYLDVFRDSIGIVRDIYMPETSVITPQIPGDYIPIEDILVDGAMSSMAAAEKEIQFLDDRIARASSANEKQALESRKQQKQQQMAEDMVFVAKYVETNTSISADKGNQVIANLGKTGKSLSGNDQAIDMVKAEVENVANDSQNATFKMNLKNVLGANFGF
ncbi:hypothetical protein [Glaciecola sp. 1036]|uniref:hypothetical protein n=1 Tax=Alteromonadaceae TaxID=72275 RepID=UPI003D086E54